MNGRPYQHYALRGTRERLGSHPLRQVPALDLAADHHGQLPTARIKVDAVSPGTDMKRRSGVSVETPLRDLNSTLHVHLSATCRAANTRRVGT
ncbi:MAG: hypothetical protein HZA90_03370 [Verrucomicrobia bacterium]|nr:hypothetical protein [Verrucomicrobiota bacterium]